MPAVSRVRAWKPAAAGIDEVFWAEFTDHAYPMHTHRSWTVLTLQTGAVRYALDRSEHGALTSLVTVLPPHVAHDGQAAQAAGFRKRVLYLEENTLGAELIGPAVDRPEIADPGLRDRIDRLHHALATVSPAPGPSPGHVAERARESGGGDWEVDSRLVLVLGRLREHLGGGRPTVGDDVLPDGPGARLARDLRDLLDADPVAAPSLAGAAATLAADPRHLVRVFTRRFGLPPHRYLTGVRVDRARRLLLAGVPPAEAALRAGFYDQSHLTRHLRTMIDTTPGRYAAVGG